jgi:SAM-dependent methyltransferase
VMTEIYDQIGHGYTQQRRTDPRIYLLIRSSLEGCASIINVGAGAGSYEAKDVPVVAVEPSSRMIAQRTDVTSVVQAVAEALPFQDNTADAVTAFLTMHHWKDRRQGLRECARVARRQVTLLTWDPASAGFWLVQDYFPEIIALDRTIFPTMDEIRSVLGSISVVPVPIPADCVDGLLGAYWQRPSEYLKPGVRSGMSSFSRIHGVATRVEALQYDIENGSWHQRHGKLLAQSALDIGYRLVTAKIQ